MVSLFAFPFSWALRIDLNPLKRLINVRHFAFDCFFVECTVLVVFGKVWVRQKLKHIVNCHSIRDWCSLLLEWFRMCDIGTAGSQPFSCFFFPFFRTISFSLFSSKIWNAINFKFIHSIFSWHMFIQAQTRNICCHQVGEKWAVASDSDKGRRFALTQVAIFLFWRESKKVEEFWLNETCSEHLVRKSYFLQSLTFTHQLFL